MEVTNKYVTLKTHVEGAPKESDFELKTSLLARSLNPGSGEMIMKNLYVSIDPYQLNRMKRYCSSQRTGPGFEGITLDKEIEAYGVAKVVVSDNVEFQKGDVVVGVITWAEYSKIRRNKMIRKLDPLGFPFSYHVGILGYSGLTAYAGFFEICKPKRGEKVLVSVASGYNCSRKNWVLMRPSTTGRKLILNSNLKRYFPDGIDIYFDNVGAEMQEAAVANMNFVRTSCKGN